MKTLILFILYIFPIYTFATQWHVKHIDTITEFRGSDHHSGIFWLAGSNSRIYKSLDRGKSWQNVSIRTDTPLDFRDIEALDSQTAIAMSAGSGTHSRLYITYNQGQNWQLLYKNQAPQGFFNSIDFWDKHNGILMGDPVDGHFVIMRTQNGGKSWQKIDPIQLPPFQEKEAAFAASGNTIITGSSKQAWFATGGFQASVYYSKNFGSTWQRTHVPLYKQTQTAGVYALALNTKNKLFALGGDYKQRDGKYLNMVVLNNQSSSSLLPTIKPKGLLTAMQCYTSTCVATGKLNSYISIDDGENWSVLTGKKGYNGFYTLTVGEGLFIAAGTKGSIGILQVDDK